MKKKFVCMLLALAVAASMAVAASAQSADTALLEKIFSKELEITNQELSQALQLAQIHEAMEENSTLLEQLQESPQAICQCIWYDEAGNRIDDPELLAKLWSAMVSRGPVYQNCCDNPSHVTFYYEEHLYDPPTPAWCVVDRYELVRCQNCASAISFTSLGISHHVHQ